MKALSFRQPWAELVLQGHKTMDLRTYTTKYRGPLAVHAARAVEEAACLAHGLDPEHIDTGGFVGVVELVDVIPLTAETYAAAHEQHLAGRHFQPGMYGWVLAESQALRSHAPGAGPHQLVRSRFAW